MRPDAGGPRVGSAAKSRTPLLEWLVVGAAAFLLLVGLGGRDLWEPDEPRIGLIAEELRSLRHGLEGLVLLHLNGEPYTQKPPLYYWLAALFGLPGGHVSELAARLPSALAGVAVVGLTFRFGARLLGPGSGLLGSGLLLSAHGFAELARRAQLDVLLACFELLALLAFWRWDRGLGSRAGNLALLHGALGAAVLVKGPVGFLVPLLGFALYLTWEGRLSAFRALAPAWALLLSLGPGLAWLAGAAALAPAGFVDEAVGVNVFGRFFGGSSHASPITFYLWKLPVEFLPWTVFWPVAWWAGRRRVFGADPDPERRRAWRLLLAWVGAAILFFSLSTGKRGLYMLPTLPAIALVCADALIERYAGPRALPAWIGGTALAVALATTAVAATFSALPGPHALAVPWSVPACLGLVTAACAAAWRRLARHASPNLPRLGLIVAGALAFEFVAANQVLPQLDPTKSPRPIAEAAAALAAPGEPLGLFGSESKLAGIAYYSGREITYLGDPDAARRFLEQGGRVVVVRADKLHRLEAAGAFAVRAELRDGRRRWNVLSFEPR